MSINVDSSISSIILQKCTKYVVLDDIIPDDFEDRVLNLFIDVRSVIGNLFTNYTLSSIGKLRENEKLLVCSLMVNLCSHYRRYFWKNFSASTNIVLFHSNRASERNLDIFPDYKKDFLNDHDYEKIGVNSEMVKFTENNFLILREICERIPNVHFIDSEGIDPDIVPQILLDRDPDFTDDDNISIFLTNRVKFFQYLSKPNFYILTMKGNKSTLINNDNFLESYTKKSGIKEKLAFPDYMSKFFLLMSAITGDKKLSIPGWTNFGPIKAVKFLDKLLTERVLRSIVDYDIDSYINILTDLATIDEDKINILKRNLKLLDIESNIDSIDEEEENKVLDQLVNKDDTSSLYNSNEKYFSRYPLKIKSLFDGED